MYKKIVALKKQNPDLKVMLAVGGWNHPAAPFTQMVSTEQSQQEFVENSYQFLKEHGFDGLDLGKNCRTFYSMKIVQIQILMFQIGNIQLIVEVHLKIENVLQI